jgi:hypothetical protein
MHILEINASDIWGLFSSLLSWDEAKFTGINPDFCGIKGVILKLFVY